MAFVRLTVRNLRLPRHVAAPVPQPDGVPFHRPGDRSGAVEYFPWHRLYARLLILPRDAGPDDRPTGISAGTLHSAVLDTGSPACVFPFPLWQPFRDEIRWLSQPAREDGQPWAITVLGGRWRYQLGRVRIGLTDGEFNWLPGVMTNALFLDDATGSASPPSQAILGLRTELFADRRLRHTRDDDGHATWLLDDH